MTTIARRAAGFAGALSPRAILVLGWTGLWLYAYPGFMSFDSIYQLQEARSGLLTDGHPPAMAELWRIVELFVTGPAGMLILQSVCFSVGAYLVLRRRMSPRRAAVLAGLVLWVPPVSSVMGVIWKDSQMAAYLLLGTGLVLSDRLRGRIAGLALIALGTAMRHNALAMTLPIVVLLFAWNPAHAAWKRYSIAIVAWLAVTMSAQLATRLLTERPTHLWNERMALLDLTGTLRYAPDLDDGELRVLLDGVPLAYTSDLQEHTRAPFDPQTSAVDTLWYATNHLFGRPSEPAQRAAVVRAWKAIVLGHPLAYLRYRWQIFRHILQITDVPNGDPIYDWFTDVSEPAESAERVGHDAAPATLQNKLRDTMHSVGGTWMFHTLLYVVISLALLPLCVRDRESFALLASGLTGEAALLVVAPTADTRYSFWLIVTTIMAMIMLIAKRAKTPA